MIMNYHMKHAKFEWKHKGMWWENQSRFILPPGYILSVNELLCPNIKVDTQWNLNPSFLKILWTANYKYKKTRFEEYH